MSESNIDKIMTVIDDAQPDVGHVDYLRKRPAIRAAIVEALDQGKPASQFSDPRVQIVYEILCDDNTPPTLEQHWEGWAARKIVDALAAAPPQAAQRKP